MRASDAETNAVDPDQLLTPAEAARLLGLSVQYLADLRWQKAGPAFVKLGHRLVRYRRADLLAWIATRGALPDLTDPTSEPAGSRKLTANSPPSAPPVASSATVAVPHLPRGRNHV